MAVARTSWFDDDSDLPLIDEQVQRLESFTKAMADGIVEEKELSAQQDRLVAAMKSVEGDLDDETHAKVTRLLVELSAYDIIRLLRELQVERARSAFGE
jgi:predicted transcriptional regulator